jgi:serine/threonine protein phosphatase PrpC
LGVVVVVETVRAPSGAPLAAAARGGSREDHSAAPPFAFAQGASGRLSACLCDGSGDWGEGVAASRVAAREAVEVCARSGLTDAESISRGLLAAHARVMAHREGELAACSAVLVVARAASVVVGWVGALDALVVRDGEVVHRTTPHLFGLELAASGRFSAEELSDFPHRSVVSRALGKVSAGREPGIDLAGPWEAEHGDLVLLCSVKVRRALSEADVTALASRDDIAAVVRGLVTTASTRGDFAELSAVALRISVA